MRLTLLYAHIYKCYLLSFFVDDCQAQDHSPLQQRITLKQVCFEPGGVTWSILGLIKEYIWPDRRIANTPRNKFFRGRLSKRAGVQNDNNRYDKSFSHCQNVGFVA